MKLLELHINGFGKIHDRTISFSDGINVIYGRNEAGKSTLHTFIRGMLFGMERGRGRAARNDLYSKYEPWENSGTYEGWMRLEQGGVVYRIERRFRKDDRYLRIINETQGREEEPTRALMDRILGGLNETTYNNTISISQLKSATEDGMVGELKNYIANMNTTGNISLNITKATAFLKNQKRSLEANLVPDASREYTALLAEIRAAYLLHRLTYSAKAPTGYDLLKMATMGSARLLGRQDEIGSLEVGKAADLFLLNVDLLELAGAKLDPACMLGTVGYARPAELVMVNGRVVVEHGRVLGMDEEQTRVRAQQLVDGMLQKAE